VRRDWSQFAADAGKAVIDIIMTDKAQDTRLAEIQVRVSKHMLRFYLPVFDITTTHLIENLLDYFYFVGFSRSFFIIRALKAVLWIRKYFFSDPDPIFRRVLDPDPNPT
jgi:hypothetical protein